MPSKESWEETALRAQAHRDKTVDSISPLVHLPTDKPLPLNVTTIPATILSEDELQITETAPETLLSGLETGKLTSLEVTNAFLRRAALAQKLTNCLVELLPGTALGLAKRCDDYLATHGKPIGPLHGLPISIKEHLAIKGTTLNLAYVGWYDHIAPEDSVIVRTLVEAGAVLYARTTEPQCTMHLETSSNLYGVTINPFNTKLTSGGSSGGEGALLGLRGSCLGVGSDIGGSIRNPAALNGVYGLRPSAFRLPITGSAGLGQDPVTPVVGPMSTTLSGISLFMKAVLDSKPWLFEPSLIPVPWSPIDPVDVHSHKLRIAIMDDDGIVRPHPPVRRALREFREQISKVRNVEVVDWIKHPDHAEAWKIVSSLYFIDGGAEETNAIVESGEPILPLTRWIMTDNPNVKRLSIEELWYWIARRETYRAEYAAAWDSTAQTSERGLPIDVIVCPAMPGAAPPLGQSKYWGYLSLFNLLDYPGLVFPWTMVQPEVDVKDENYQPRNEQDKFNYDLYEPETYRDAPVGLQMVARRCEDEKLVGILEYLQEEISSLAGNPWTRTKQK